MAYFEVPESHIGGARLNQEGLRVLRGYRAEAARRRVVESMALRELTEAVTTSVASVELPEAVTMEGLDLVPSAEAVVA